MSTIVDRRQQGGSHKNADRKKFLDRYNKSIKEAADRVVSKKKIKGSGDDSQKVKIPIGPMDEPTFAHDPNTGKRERVFPGNDRFVTGDKQLKPDPSAGEGGYKGSPDGGGEDDFEFALSKKEFLDVIFSDMALPNYVKQSLSHDVKYNLVRAGYTTDGPINRLNLKKTFQQSLARRLAFKGARAERGEEEDERKIPFLEDVDLRYNLYQKEPFPVRKAVMFCVLDVSGSMTEYLKDLAKRFLLLLYLFLDRQYDKIDIRFIRHAESAQEVEEDAFFHERATGGTIVSTAFYLIQDIINTDYSDDSWNMYVAQASDGDNWWSDNEELTKILHRLLPQLQYMAYIQVSDPNQPRWMGLEPDDSETLFGIYNELESYRHFKKEKVSGRTEVFPVLRGLFKKGADDE